MSAKSDAKTFVCTFCGELISETEIIATCPHCNIFACSECASDGTLKEHIETHESSE